MISYLKNISHLLVLAPLSLTLILVGFFTRSTNTNYASGHQGIFSIFSADIAHADYTSSQGDGGSAGSSDGGEGGTGDGSAGGTGGGSTSGDPGSCGSTNADS